MTSKAYTFRSEDRLKNKALFTLVGSESELLPNVVAKTNNPVQVLTADKTDLSKPLLYNSDSLSSDPYSICYQRSETLGENCNSTASNLNLKCGQSSIANAIFVAIREPIKC